MSDIGYAGHGAEIEEDIVRLRRRKLEFDDDAARRARRGEPRPRLRVFHPVSAVSAAITGRR
jgi:hypothetical protein